MAHTPNQKKQHYRKLSPSATDFNHNSTRLTSFQTQLLQIAGVCCWGSTSIGIKRT